MPRIPVKSIDGFALAIDPKKLENVMVIEGANFLLDIDGPRSAFGTSGTHRQMEVAEFVSEFTLGAEHFYLANASTDSTSTCYVYKMDWTIRQWVYQFEMPQQYSSAARKQHPWSHALVGGNHYLCSLGFGVWQYNATAAEWTNVTATLHTNFGTALPIYGVCAAAGRLCLLVQGFAWWSAIDDGTDVVPSTGTGAGFQNLALIGTPTVDADYKGIFSVGDGFLTCTAAGVMKSTIISSLNPFRHDPLTSEFIPFNQNCVARLSPSELIFFTPSGFYSTDGRQFTPWQVLMSEYLVKTYVPNLSLTAFGQVQLHYDVTRKWFFISLANTGSTNLFAKAFALYIPRDQWGSFDKLHRAFVAVDEFGDNSKLNFGYISFDSKLHMFADTTADLKIEAQTASEVLDQNEVFYMETLQDNNAVRVGGVTYASAAMRIDSNEYVHAYMTAFGITYPTAAGWYETWKEVWVVEDTRTTAPDDPATTSELALSATVNAAWNIAQVDAVTYGFAKQELQQDALDAEVTIGLFRITDNAASQQITELQEMAISMPASVGSAADAEDWMNDYADDILVDWAALSETVEDWGYGVLPGSVYGHAVIGTLDGLTQWEEQTQEFDLRLADGKTIFYVGNIQGLYCQLQITANLAGQSFHLNDLEFSGSLAGVI